jgi:hypothetical protein
MILIFLKSFYRAKKIKEDFATIDRILFAINILIQYFKKNLNLYESDIFFYFRIKKSWIVFDKYYLKIEDSLYYTATIILHPSRRIGYLKHNWEKK